MFLIPIAQRHEPLDFIELETLDSALLSVLRNTFKYTWCSYFVLSGAVAYAAAPTIHGQSGYINMPNASVEKDGTFSVGYGYDSPYGALWATSTILPFMQVTGQYASITGIPAFTTEGDYGSNYGRYKDKVVDMKVQLWEEHGWRPALAVGATDLLGTGLFKGQYLVATKSLPNLENVEMSVGYARKRPSGLFAGMRWAPAVTPNWALVAEYDAIDYRKDFRADETGASRHGKGGGVVGLEYRWGWLGAQLARHRDHFSANAYLSIPLARREFVPKLAEPTPFEQKNAPPRVSMAEWQRDGKAGAAMVGALAQQDFQNIRVELDNGTMRLVLTSSRISNLGRAVGRASRTALAFAPAGTRRLLITYTANEQPVATYEFQDLYALSYYLGGSIERDAFLRTVIVRSARPDDGIDLKNQNTLTDGMAEQAGFGVDLGRDGNAVQLRSEDRERNRIRIAPKLGLFFNDPSGALRYEIDAAANYDKRLGAGLYLNGALTAKLIENVSDVTQQSNSLLPHVRTDIAEYKRGSRFKINKLMLNQFLMPAENWYARLSGGLYEEMFRGAGGQLLFAPQDTRWAADLSVDALQQRGYKGLLDSRDYTTVTALGALHYRLPSDVTLTARAGRFLAKDVGVRIEAKRRFLSGVEVGAWYTRTNGNDITNPGTPTSPYRDKGVFVNISLSSMLTKDTQAVAGIAISPWTRDVGQMVTSPGDLYDMIEKPRRDIGIGDGLGNLGERPDEQALAALYVDPKPLVNPWPAFRLRLEQAANNSPTLPEWAGGSAVAGAALLAGAVLDKPVDKFVKKHQENKVVRTFGNFGKAMPLVLVGGAGAALAFGDDRASNIGLISMEAVAASIGMTQVGKYAVGRARPGAEQGPWSQVDGNRSNASFPSGHSAVSFAAVTPFAKEYDAPWLYGVAALSSAGRVAARQHWVSDTVAGGILGYAVGSWLWQSQRDNRGSVLSVVPTPKSINVAWSGSY